MADSEGFGGEHDTGVPARYGLATFDTSPSRPVHRGDDRDYPRRLEHREIEMQVATG